MLLDYLLFAILTYAAYNMYYYVPVGDRGNFREDGHTICWIAASLVGGWPVLLFSVAILLILYTVEMLKNGLPYKPQNLLLFVIQAVTIYEVSHLLTEDVFSLYNPLGIFPAMFLTLCITQLVTVAISSWLFRVSLRVGGWKRKLLKFNLIDSLYLSLYFVSSAYIETLEIDTMQSLLMNGTIMCALLGLYYWRTVGILQTQRVQAKILEVEALNLQITQANQQVLLAFASALEKRDPYTAGHSERVATYAVQIGRELGLSEKDLGIIRLGGLLHDIGKIGIPDSVLIKPGKLTAEEYDVMKQHPVIGEELLRGATLDDLNAEEREKMLEIVLSHHERPDGRGYPHGLVGAEIPLFAKLTAVADAFDAMTSNRAYRSAMPIEKAASILVEGCDTQFWTPAVKAFLKTLGQEALMEAAPTRTAKES
ncbi:HD-GYP domain-containing protein [Tumebacillus algifaecis]|uniref:HD-GYP domain-containing protein n=1 Tax=Tumebacillus algifaecis TaxID=1214604 RepID=UPI0012FD1E09|nr:HD-GYP domain-containing protein [Tumebacillus algifaecis]